MKKESVDDKTNLKIFKYFIGEINYSGKIQRDDDRVLLNAIIDDIFCAETAFNKHGIEENLAKCHYGIPSNYAADNE